jgi:aminoglycoside/choline kinase family phosphotransferase
MEQIMTFSPAHSSTDKRMQLLQSWSQQLFGLDGWCLQPASADASFRRYFRLSKVERSYIVMDAPPDREALAPFIDITARLLAAGVHAPRIHAQDESLGFLLLDDLGDQPFLGTLSPATVSRLYGDALNALFHILQADHSGLPAYDEALLLREMALFEEWFLRKHLGIHLDDQQLSRLAAVQHALAANALEQPQRFVHRDYHSRNLMLVDSQNPGIIDYQDAVVGPVTYDLVSLLRDCYIAWPRQQVQRWALDFRDRMVDEALISSVSDERFLRWFDLMGVQRHLKAIGIFSRLNHRDNKPGYLGDIPRTLGYIRDVAVGYEELQPLLDLIENQRIFERLST